MALNSTVLIVDDASENLHVLMECLHDEYSILAAKNGEKALEIARSAPQPDLILLDILMPGMDGYEVCRRLKADEKTSEIPIIFITALSEAESETKGLGLGAIDYITKPFNPDIVKARVRNHLQLRTAFQLKEDVERIIRHDLKNPLNAILGLSQLLALEGDLSQEQRELVEILETASRRMARMINMSLDLFKMETGAYQYLPEKVDVLPLIEEIQEDTHSLFATKRLETEVTVDGTKPDGPFLLEGVEQLLYTMLSNFIVNAAEASPSGETIRVRLEKKTAPFMSITNQGAVPKEIRDHFFHKYKTFGKNSGTGLGTYSAKLIADTMGYGLRMDIDDEANTTTITIVPPGGG